MKQVKITVTAQPGHGKSTIAALIINMLEMHGISCRVTDADAQFLTPPDIGQNLHHLGAGVEVEIECVQSNREADGVEE